MKKNLVKKIASIVVVSLVCVLVLVTVVLALVPKRLENVVAKGYSGINIYYGDSDQSYTYTSNPDKTSNKYESYVKQNEVIEKIASLHEASLKDSVLSAIFQGVGSFHITVSTTSSSKSSNALTAAKSESDKVIVFEYAETQDLVIGGEKYKYKESTSAKPVTFDKIVMPVGSSDSFEECTLYLINEDSTTYKSTYQVKFLAHQSELADYIATLDFVN